MGKNIVLCSDGTGNKGGYGADTNVFKIYNAVDIHNAKTQITFYDDGVGTSTNKFIRAVTGAFGIGFGGNIRDLYAFLSRNYDPGDEIFMFGFSRGAATVRAFGGMVQECGLLNVDGNFCKSLDKSKNLKFDEAKFANLVKKAFKAYQKIKTDSDVAAEFKKKHGVEVEAENGETTQDIPIKFIGVWDTVSALGFPKDWSLALKKIFDWLEKLLDRCFPNSFYNYQLNQNVEYVYHALAIDDERQTFHPKVWTETRSDRPRYIEQVWFAGAHSNVGGGYPRAGLSVVAYDWMLTRAAAQGLEFKDGVEDAARAAANVYGKLYDSRDGAAVYYRYAPRNIEALCEGRLEETVKVHKTVLDRMKARTMGYAPGFLPRTLDIVDTPVTSPPRKVSWTFDPSKIQESVAKRKWLYRWFVEATLVVIVGLAVVWSWFSKQEFAAPKVTLSDLISFEGWSSAFEWISGLYYWVAGHLADFLVYIVPEFVEPFVVYALLGQPFVSLGVIGVFVVIYFYRERLRKNSQRACEEAREVLLKELEKKFPNGWA